jgi:hypothetical protein
VRRALSYFERTSAVTLGSHQTTIGKSQVHITPKYFIDRLGPFGLDPAAALPRFYNCAEVNWHEGGLERGWPKHLLVWLNPPFDRYVVSEFIERLERHGNGVALLHARTEAGWFEPIWRSASGILFLADRIKFFRPDGTEQPANSGAPPVLVSFGDEALTRLQRCGIAGYLVTSWHTQSAGAVLRVAS